LADEPGAIQLPAGVTEKETYVRETLSIGDASIYIYRHESLTAQQVLDRLIESYKAWAVNRSGSPARTANPPRFAAFDT
jgi:hypothetical protein